MQHPQRRPWPNGFRFNRLKTWLRKKGRMKTIAIAVCCLVGMVLLTGAWAQQYSEWAQPVNLGPTVNSSTGDFHSCISKDGLTLYFTSARPHGNPPRTDWDIWVTHRASIDSAWGA